MAMLPACWRFTVLLLINHRVLAANSLPSKPTCYIPCNDLGCRVDIQCLWDQWEDHSLFTNYTLHWETANHRKGHVNTGERRSEIINRKDFSRNGNLSVWVRAVHQNGSSESPRTFFTTREITKPPAPKITLSHRDPLEIHWNLTCRQLQLSMGSCHVRHRAETDKEWIETDIGSCSNYEVNNLVLPGLFYELQVRCSCPTLMSDWSDTLRIMSQEMAPVGKLDVWRDCEEVQGNPSCILMWKKLPRTQARGQIQGYLVLINNGSVVQMNISALQPNNQLVCDETKCHLNITLTPASSISICAYNSVGATEPAQLHFLKPGKENKVNPHFQMDTERLDVFWKPPAHLSDKDYVVQFKQVGQPPGQGFDWLRGNQSFTSYKFKDQFKKYKPYKVSLYEDSVDGTSCHSSFIAYSLQTIPPKVPTFKVIDIGTNHVTLFWEKIPLSMQTGKILYYLIGEETLHDVHNVTALQKEANQTFEMFGLSPGRDYEVWLTAVTAAGPGENVTVTFKTKHEVQNVRYALLTIIGSSALIIFVCTLIFVRARQTEEKLWLLCFSKHIPDPHNSLIFKEMEHQINDWAAFSIPILEPHPKISTLEVMETKPSEFNCLETFRTQDCDKIDQRCKQEEYSQMLDSDEEQAKEQQLDFKEQWSSDEEDFTSGYEKRFMPTAQEILGIQLQYQS